MSESGKAVFLSYASQDSDAAKRVCEALRAAGIEVWFDQNELRGGDSWDAKIRKQIKDCALFIPIISTNTQSRAEGYFRLEWHLAEQRSHLIARGRPFIVPVTIDETRDTDALVPDAFLAVQWMRLPGGHPNAAFAERLKSLLGAEPVGAALRRDPAQPSDHGESQHRAAPTRKSFRYVWLAGAALVVAGVAAFFIVRQPAVVGSAATASPPGQPELSEVDKLVARATAILDGSALSPEQIGAANDLLVQAMDRDPSNAAAWTAAARADLMMIHPYGYDRAEERRQRAMSRATRALTLAPDSFATRVMHTAVMAHASGNPDLTREAEETFRRLMKERPGDTALPLRLAEVLREQRRFEEAAPVFESIGEFEIAAWSWYQAGQNAAAYDQVKRAVLAKRTTTALLLKAQIESHWFQNLATAHATMAEFRPSELREELPANSAIGLAFLRRDPERMLQIVNALSHDFMDSHGFVGPRQYWSGWAHHLGGRSERAAIEWRKALPILHTERAKAPDRVELFDVEAEIHALLGENDEASRLLATAQRIANQSLDVVNVRNYEVHLALGHHEQVLAWLTTFLREKPVTNWYQTHALARFSPVWDGLRGDPRLEALLRETMPADAKPFDDLKPPTRDPGSAPPPAPDNKSVAVLAFANLSDDKGNEYFSDGISEELLNVLAKIPGLKVSARTSAFHFKGKDTSIPEIAQQLGVAYVVEGSVRKSGDRVRITAQLIKAADGFHVWSDTFTRDLKDIFAVQDEIAGLIAQQLKLKLEASTRVAREVNPEAYRLVLEGRYFWNQRSSAALSRAEELYTRALAIDPDFAEAHAALADLWVIRGWYLGMAGGSESVVAGHFAKARAEVDRALALDPGLADAFAALGAVLFSEFKFDESLRQFARAVTLNPNRGNTRHWHSIVLGGTGRIEEAYKESEVSVSLDPLLPTALWNAAAIRYFDGRWHEVLALCDRALAVRPGFLPVLGYQTLVFWGLGRKEDAVKVARAIAADRDAEIRWEADYSAIYVLAQSGLKQEAEALLERISAPLPPDSHRRAFALAAVGRGDEALNRLKTFPPMVMGNFASSPIWDLWREDSRFTRLMTDNRYLADYERGRAAVVRLRKEQEKSR